MRLDVYLTLAGACRSRTRAQRLIDDGAVYVNGIQARKASREISEGDAVELRRPDMRYVSRGGLKLEAALDSFGVDPSSRVCVDIGASTGGFTDCLLQRGAARVYCVDSGRDQLAPKLRSDPRVHSLEAFNARNLSGETLGESCSLAVMDVSFISQTLLYGAVAAATDRDGEFISLIKPQFEAGRSAVGKNGIVRDKSVHAGVIVRIASAAEMNGLRLLRLIRSPIEGGDGNIEYLGLFRFADRAGAPDFDIDRVVYGK